MTVPTYNFVWQQGEDGIISIVYKDGSNNPIDLTGASIRMDVASQGNPSTVLYTFNSEDLTDPVDTNKEATLGGAAGTINIKVPRSVSLTGGALFSSIGQALTFDIFLRQGTAPNETQKKLLSGSITIEPSVTKWA